MTDRVARQSRQRLPKHPSSRSGVHSQRQRKPTRPARKLLTARWRAGYPALQTSTDSTLQ